MKKEELRNLMLEHGDAVIDYRSKNSRKLKYNVCTLDFNNAYIQNKQNRAKESDGTLLMFCWDTDSYRLMNTQSVVRVRPLSDTLKNEKI